MDNLAGRTWYVCRELLNIHGTVTAHGSNLIIALLTSSEVYMVLVRTYVSWSAKQTINFSFEAMDMGSTYIFNPTPLAGPPHFGLDLLINYKYLHASHTSRKYTYLLLLLAVSKLD